MFVIKNKEIRWQIEDFIKHETLFILVCLISLIVVIPIIYLTKSKKLFYYTKIIQNQKTKSLILISHIVATFILSILTTKKIQYSFALLEEKDFLLPIIFILLLPLFSVLIGIILNLLFNFFSQPK